MNCACGCCGMGRLSFSILGGGLRGLRGGLGEIKAGSEVAVGIKYSTGSLFEDPPDIENLISTVIGCLYGTGAFSYVGAEVSRGFFDNYLTVKATLSTGFNQPEDIGGLIEGRIRECYPEFAPLIKGRDRVAVYKVPLDPSQPVASVQVPAGAPGGPPAPDNCSTKSGIDYLTCKAGFDGSASGGGIGSTGLILALLGAVIVSKVFSK